MVKKKKKFEIENDTLLQRDPEQEFTYIDGEVVMLSLKNGEYYGLDEVGTRIWELIEKPINYNDLIIKLLGEFDVSRKICEEDTRECIIELFEKQLVKI